MVIFGLVDVDVIMLLVGCMVGDGVVGLVIVGLVVFFVVVVN